MGILLSLKTINMDKVNDPNAGVTDDGVTWAAHDVAAASTSLCGPDSHAATAYDVIAWPTHDAVTRTANDVATWLTHDATTAHVITWLNYDATTAPGRCGVTTRNYTASRFRPRNEPRLGYWYGHVYWCRIWRRS